MKKQNKHSNVGGSCKFSTDDEIFIQKYGFLKNTHYCLPKGVKREEYWTFECKDKEMVASSTRKISYIIEGVQVHCDNIGYARLTTLNYILEGGVLYSRDRTRLISMLTNINKCIKFRIPDRVKVVEDNAFYNCLHLENIYIPDTVTHIGRGAFALCENLKSITIPKNIATLGECAFYECRDLSEVNLSSTLTSIDNHTFCMCYSLRNLTLPSSITSIGEAAFSYCGIESVELPNSIISISKNAFEQSSIQSITLPNRLTVIEEELFGSCMCLKKVFIPNSVKEIKDCAFLGSNNIEVVIPNSIEILGDGIFDACYGGVTICISKNNSHIKKFMSDRDITEIKYID